MTHYRPRPEDRIKARPELQALEARDVPAFTTPVFTTVGPVSDTQPVDWNLVASVRVTSDLAETAGGTQVTVTLKDIRTDHTPVTVNLLTYTRTSANPTPPGDISQQRLFDLDTAVLDRPGQTITLKADLPPCSLYQADVALGTLSPAVTASLQFPNTNIESVFGVNNNCPPTVPPPPPSTGFAPKTQGYWKNHADAWPVSSLTLGGITYTKAQLLTIFNTPVKGNGAIALAHQLIAAKLNAASGATVSPAVALSISQADALLATTGNLLSGGSLSTSATSSLTEKLDAFNSSGD
jgi:hypothetical protein